MSAPGRSGASIFAAPSPGLSARGARIPLTRARGASQHGASARRCACTRESERARERARGRHGPRPRRPPGLPRPRRAPSRPHAKGRSFPDEHRAGDPRPLEVGRAHSRRRRRRRRTTFPTRGCVTGRHVRGRRGSSRPARERRPQAQSAALRPAERTTPSSPSRSASQRLAGRPGAFVRLLTRPGLAGIRPVARGDERRRRRAWMQAAGALPS
ncbi:serine/arginine repetitive matrix protein 1-like [Peromyscus leucopus]|uniref:serine/arginine repetitive matrix protein 1-like n=1 Tax=Peromyscus leucopus TaxID=10041 RepID=UPI0018850371|nr:serine/arginine repetitive matrix protein 1-like [Peromyscus leucopus]